MMYCWALFLEKTFPPTPLFRWMFLFVVCFGGQWSASVLERVTAEGKAGKEGLSKLAFLVMGVMATLAALFKQGHRYRRRGPTNTFSISDETYLRPRVPTVAGPTLTGYVATV